MISYRTMNEGDIPDGLSLCRAAGWNQTSDDWELFLNLSPGGCRVAVDEEGTVRGTVATVRYEHRFSWIGMVLVDASRRRQGIGMQLIREALEILKEEETVKLDATPAGREVYKQLGFVDEYSLTRMQWRKKMAALPSGVPMTEIAHDDLQELMAWDRRVFGADREPVLSAIWKRAPRYGFMRREGKEIAGFCLGRSGHEFAHIGPVIASHMDTAMALVSAAICAAHGAPVVIDVPHVHRDSPLWMERLSAIGFEVQRPLIRMYRGRNAHPGIPENQFAILGPEFG